MRVYFYASTKKRKGLMWLSLASLLISLYSNGMSCRRTWHRLTSATYCPRRSRWFYLSPAIFLSSLQRWRRLAHAFCSKALLSPCLHCHSFLLWVWLILLFQKNEETRRAYSFFTLPLTPSCLRVSYRYICFDLYLIQWTRASCPGERNHLIHLWINTGWYMHSHLAIGPSARILRHLDNSATVEFCCRIFRQYWKTYIFLRRPPLMHLQILGTSILGRGAWGFRSP